MALLKKRLVKRFSNVYLWFHIDGNGSKLVRHVEYYQNQPDVGQDWVVTALTKLKKSSVYFFIAIICCSQFHPKI